MAGKQRERAARETRRQAKEVRRKASFRLLRAVPVLPHRLRGVPDHTPRRHVGSAGRRCGGTTGRGALGSAAGPLLASLRRQYSMPNQAAIAHARELAAAPGWLHIRKREAPAPRPARPGAAPGHGPMSRARRYSRGWPSCACCGRCQPAAAAAAGVLCRSGGRGLGRRVGTLLHAEELCQHDEGDASNHFVAYAHDLNLKICPRPLKICPRGCCCYCTPPPRCPVDRR